MAIAYNQRTHRCGDLRVADAGQSVILAGWVDGTRNHGGMVFVDVRDHTGITQLRFDPDAGSDAHARAGVLRCEDVIAVTGEVAPRGGNVNPKLPTGEVEVVVRECDVLSKADTPPLEVVDDLDASEELRLRYRYLDLRRPSIQKVFRTRHLIGKTIRDYFDENDFIEIETPFLTKSTPEGARDYLVPSRVKPGSFYALPQSPQIFKQLFMVSGFDRYAQIVRCFRDEDLRADRQPEFTQLDMEMAFVQADDVMTMVEGCVRRMFQAVLDIDVQTPLPRMTEAEAMERYGTDRPDTRFGMELRDVTDLVRGCEFKVFTRAIEDGGVVKCLVAPGAAESLTRKITDGLTDELKGIGAAGLPITRVTAGADGLALATGVAKFLQPVCGAVCEHIGARPGDVIFFMPGTFHDACKYLNYLRGRLADLLSLIPDGCWNLLWVVDFPLFVWDDQEKRWTSTHHPFTAPNDEDLAKLDTDPGDVRSKAYDLVLNGMEMAGGSIRIHRRDIQSKVFTLLGISDEEAHAKFEFLLEALRYGAPPHGGIAFGFDRWAMMLTGQASLRDVVAFPKTQRAVCPLTGAPAPVSTKQLDELRLRVALPPSPRAAVEG